MALPSTLVWECQTTGDDTNNAGSYDPAVAGAVSDYSLLSPLAFSDLTVDATTNTIVTSASIGFTSAHVGNSLRIVSGTGFSAGVFSIRSVSAGKATLDRSPAAVGTAGGTGRLGGALASPGQVAATGFLASGNTVWNKAGTYLIGSGTANTATNRVDSSVASAWYGYQTTRGDWAARPRLEANASNITLFRLSNTGSIVVGLEAYRNPGGSLTSVKGFNLAGTGLMAKACWALNCNNMGFDVGAAGVTLIGCRADGCSGPYGAFGTSSLGPSGVAFLGCVAANSPGGTHGFSAPYFGSRFARCLSVGNGGDGFQVPTGNHGCLIDGCVAHGNSGHGFELIGANNLLQGCVAVNQSVASKAGFFFNGSTSFNNWMRGCAGYNNTSSIANAAACVLANEGYVTLTADPFANAAGLDFSLNGTAGGGAALKGAGYPASFPGLAGTSAPDIGAYQSQGGASGPTYFVF